MKIAYVEYAFLFDPTKTWARLYEFETELKNFLSSKGLDGVILDTIGTSGKKIIYVRVKDKIDQSVGEPKPKGRPLSVKTQIERLKRGKESAKVRDFRKGKLLKRKGYLKRG